MTWTVGNGRFALDDRLRAGSSDEVRLGHLAADPTTRVLVTLTARHAADQLARFASAEVVYVGATDAGVPYEDALVERLPEGVAASSRVPFDEVALVRFGAELLAWIADAHARGTRVGGAHPDLVFVSDAGRLTGLCPNGIEFIATAPQPMHGPRSYRVPYVAPEVLFTGQADLSSDVFAACATLFFLGTGRHPFGDPADLRQLMSRAQAGRIEPWPGSDAVGELFARGLARDSRARPSAGELAAAISSIDSKNH